MSTSLLYHAFVNRTRFPGHKFVIMRLPWSSMIL